MTSERPKIYVTDLPTSNAGLPLRWVVIITIAVVLGLYAGTGAPAFTSPVATGSITALFAAATLHRLISVRT
jgi:hypothetical protein